MTGEFLTNLYNFIFDRMSLRNSKINTRTRTTLGSNYTRHCGQCLCVKSNKSIGKYTLLQLHKDHLSCHFMDEINFYYFNVELTKQKLNGIPNLIQQSS